jgi:hypothetical protein
MQSTKVNRRTKKMPCDSRAITRQEINPVECNTTAYEGKPFIPAWLDDLDLTPIQFRLYAHMVRRAGINGIAWPAHRSIEKVCHVTRKTVSANLKILVGYGLLVPLKKDRRGHITYGVRLPASVGGGRLLNPVIV